MTINDPAVIAELTTLAHAYERALITNDVKTLSAMFWASPHAVRFGATENLYGADEIEAFRRARPATGLAREARRLTVVCFGQDVGSVTLEFARPTASGMSHGRQSQMWVRLPGVGWRIVSAHVSLLP